MRDPNITENITNTGDDAMLPQGWGVSDDIFADPATWTGEAGADEPGAEQEQDAGVDGLETAGEAAPTTELPEAGDAEDAGKGDAPTTEQDPAQDAPTTEQKAPEAANTKLKFKAKFNSEERDVELDESELPGVYQRALNHDRAQSKLAKLSPLMENAEAMAKRLGYESLEDMIGKADQNYLNAEVKRLTDDGVHEEVARDVVQRRMDKAARQSRPESGAAGSPAGSDRDFRGETAQLLQARPELRGQRLPDEVVTDSVRNGKNLLAAYAEYEARQERAKAESLQERVRILEQNAAGAAKGPVKGVSGSGSVKEKGADPFLEGFNSDY